MIVRNFQEAEASDRRVVTKNWESTRLVLRADGMGFSVHVTTIYPGTETSMWYRNHLEAVYIIEGEGEVETLDDGKVYPLSEGVIYALDKNDRHVLRTKTRMRMVCVFNPALVGQEVHDADGVYPLELRQT